MESFYKTSAYICLALSLGLIAVMILATPAKAESSECTSARMIAAYTWAALDDAEREGLSSGVVENLEMELAAAVEVAKAICE
jgi:hypothetical protein